MSIKCPNCGYEFDVNSFRTMFREGMGRHGYEEVVVEEILRNSSLFDRVREVVMEEIREQERAKAKARREAEKYAQELKNKMTIDEKIEMLNTPYDDLPEELKPGMRKYPQVFNFVRMHQPNIGEQQDTCGARILKFQRDGNLDEKTILDTANVFMENFDLKNTKKHKAQKTRLTHRDFVSYTNCNTSPKIDKMTGLTEAMGMTIDYFAGYGPDSRIPRNQIIAPRFRKNAKEKTA